MVNNVIPRAKNIDVNARINNKWEYRYNVVSNNGKVIQWAHQWFNSRSAMEHNMELTWLNPDLLPSRITKD